MKILASCYACSPYQGSEPGMGWNFVSNLSKMHELYIITESKFKADLDRYFTEHPEMRENMHFYFVRKERHKILRKIWPPSYYWFYQIWQKKAYRLAVELNKKENFDLIHQLNMIGFREPGYLWKMNKPLVWGPIGGFHISPWRLLPSMGLRGCLFYGIRNILNLWQTRFTPRVNKMALRSSYIISATQDSYEVVTKLWHRNTVIIPEVGLTTISKHDKEYRRDVILRICWSGTHTPGKSLNLLLEAVCQCQHQKQVEIHVAGDGVYTKRWKQLAKKLKLENVFWYGWIPRDKALQLMQNADIFVITSLCDATSTVVLEALSMGLPIVALNHMGFANVVTEECGIKIDVNTKKQVVRDLANAIDRLYEDWTLRKRLSDGAEKRAKDFMWEKKAEQINQIYNDVRYSK